MADITSSSKIGITGVPFKMNLRRLTATALILGGFAIICGWAVGYFAYGVSREHIVEAEFRDNLSHARTYSKLIGELSDGSSPSEILMRLNGFWSSREMEHPGDYLCFVDKSGRLMLHTGRPEAVGKEIGGNIIEPSYPGGPKTLRELVHAKQDWVGWYYSPALDESQITAFAYNPQLDGIVAVHIPNKAIDAEVRQTAMPWMFGFGFISSVFLPLSLWMLYLAYSSSSRAAISAQEELQKRAEDLSVAVKHKLEAHALLDSIFASAPIGLAYFDESFRFVRINDTLSAINGRSASDHIGRNIKEVIPNLSPKILSYMKRVVETGMPIIDVEIEGESPVVQGEKRNWLASYYPVSTMSGTAIGVGAVVIDITARKLAERKEKALRDLLRIISRAQSQYIADVDRNTLFENILADLLSLTSSEFGFIGEFFHAKTERPYLKTHAVADIAWNEDARDFHDMKTLIDAVIETGKPVISDSPATDSLTGEAALDRPPLKKFLGLPIYQGETLVGMVGLADSPEGYGEELVEYMQPILSTCASIIEAFRSDQQRKQAEEQIKSSLKEKEVLLKEVHHRVKNNLQIVSSLLNIQSSYIKDAKTLDVFKESRRRIRSMALIHEKLYQSRDLTGVDFADYINSLATYLFHLYRANSNQIVFKVDAEGISLGLDAAIPCGLIINELVSNSLKYAFAGRERGIIEAGLRRVGDGRISLTIADDGIGLPPNFDIGNTDTLGLQLVSDLALQLNGQIEMRSEKGTAFIITFSESKQR